MRVLLRPPREAEVLKRGKSQERTQEEEQGSIVLPSRERGETRSFHGQLSTSAIISLLVLFQQRARRSTVNMFDLVYFCDTSQHFFLSGETSIPPARTSADIQTPHYPFSTSICFNCTTWCMDASFHYHQSDTFTCVPLSSILSVRSMHARVFWWRVGGIYQFLALLCFYVHGSLGSNLRVQT